MRALGSPASTPCTDVVDSTHTHYLQNNRDTAMVLHAQLALPPCRPAALSLTLHRLAPAERLPRVY